MRVTTAYTLKKVFGNLEKVLYEKPLPVTYNVLCDKKLAHFPFMETHSLYVTLHQTISLNPTEQVGNGGVRVQF
jgi:hypothetical protein